MIDPINRLIAAAILAAVTLVSCSSPVPEDPALALAKVEEERHTKDRAFASEGSPVPPEKRDDLLPLAYYEPSLEYRVPAVLRPSQERPEVVMPTSTGQQRRMMRVGRLEFTLKGQPLTLSAFVDAETRDLSRLFVPFTDLTSGSETYPAGRYMDLDRTATGLYEIDFNRAYNPFCYYNPEYDCPYPPRENRLQVPIRAGERMKS
jgi:uncharacterized protein (DUF1684 family)